MELTEAQYERIKEALPVQRGNVSLSNLQVLNTVLCVAEQGCKWRGLPKRFGRWHTVYMRMSRSSKAGVLDRVFEGCGLLQNPGAACTGCGANIASLKSPFAGFRFHDLRHQAITELAESKASDQTIMSIADHVSKKILQHYSHVRLEAKRDALDALTMGRGKQSDSERTKQELRHKRRHKRTGALTPHAASD